MERNYAARRPARRSRYSGGSAADVKTKARAIRLVVCAGIFALAALFKLMFPGAYETVTDKFAGSVDVKAAFSVIGEGISGERELGAALSEAFTYAFVPANAGGAEPVVVTEGDDTLPPDDAVGAMATDNQEAPVTSPDGDAAPAMTDTPSEGEPEDGIQSDAEDFSNAVRSAFLESQDVFSDYSIPAGVSYEMPPVSFEYAAPLSGAISSSFGFRMHPVEGEVKFHYGTDISAAEGDTIRAFSDGTVFAVGESTTLGNYIILQHNGAETTYAHCSEVSVSSGQAVAIGDEIGKVGATGNATASCLHFELKVDGEYVNSEYYVLWG